MAQSIAGPQSEAINRKLQDGLKPSKLQVVNESHMHAGHMGNPDGAADAETHFRVEIVSDEFQGKPMVARHRMVYGLLQSELTIGGVHALALKTKTSAEAAR
ncbi:hypothetical protein WJX84_009480 [Apatococcus fuscideae]|uniref:BolA family transcriptional regulator n=1 Tax=Apatococcus fuscideae TaxID=2026836 RepID=A0AAW1SW18_9CHLO